MEDKVSNKLIRQLRNQVNDLSAAVQLLTPLVTEHGRRADVDCLSIINKDLYQLIRTICHMELCENEDHPFCPRCVDVADLCREVGEAVELMAERLGVDFTWRLDRKDILSVADKALLKLAILNMLTNAFQAAGKDGKVSLRCGVAGGKIKLVVSDNGEGLEQPEEDENLLLKTDGGLGLGLEAARRVAALHGGRLMLFSTANNGVCSVLFLPIQKPTKEELVGQRKKIGYDPLGGYSPLLVEFSPLLGPDSFLPGDVE